MKLRNFDRQLRVYRQRIGWIALDLWRTFPLRVIVVTAFYAAGVVTGASTIGLILFYARHLSTDESLTLVGIDIPRPEGPGAYWIAGLIGALGLLSATWVYLGQWGIARLAVAYQRECERRLFRITTDEEAAGWAGLLPGPAMSEITSLRGFGCKVLAMTARRMVKVVLPLIMLVVSTAALIVADPLLTLMLLPLGLFYIVPLYLVNKSAAKLQRRYQTETPAIRRAVSQKLKDAVRATPAEAEAVNAEADVLLDDPIYFQAGLMFFRRKLLSEETKFLNMALFFVGLVVLFIYAAINSSDPSWSWVEFAVFIVALRFVVFSLHQATSIFIKLSRFLPNYRVYIEFIQAVDEMRERRRRADVSGGIPKDGIDIRMGRTELTGADSRVSVTPGCPLWVLCPFRLNEADLEGMAVRLEQRTKQVDDLLRMSRFCAASDDDSEIPVPSDLASVDRRDELLSSFAKLGVDEALAPILHALDAGEEPDVSALSREAAWALSAAEALLDGSAVLVNAGSMKRLNKDFLEALRRMWFDRLVVFVARDPDLVLSSSLKHWTPRRSRVVVMDRNEFLGGGNRKWLESNLNEITERLTREAGNDDDDETLDLEEFED